MTATVIGPLESSLSTVGTIEYGHDVSVDGIGPTYDGLQIARRPCDMVPIDDRPEAGSWDEICALTRGWRPGVVRCG